MVLVYGCMFLGGLGTLVTEGIWVQQVPPVHLGQRDAPRKGEVGINLRECPGMRLPYGSVGMLAGPSWSGLIPNGKQ